MSESSVVALPDVTICAADTAFVPLTVRALKRSMDQCTFGDAILFSDQTVDGPFRSVQIPPMNSVRAYSNFCLYGLPNFIKTPFALVIQWDGYVVNAAAWANAFRKYDYIGAAWHGVFPPGVPLVGNGGFSLRSSKLLQAAKRLPAVGGYHEDRVICHVFGKQLEQKSGIRFAPVKIADRFSYQFKIPEMIPFGFHGIEHMWRYADDDELAAAVAQMQVGKMHPFKTLELIRNCVTNGMFNAAAALLAQSRKFHSAWMLDGVRKQATDASAATAELAELERLIKERGGALGAPLRPAAPQGDLGPLRRHRGHLQGRRGRRHHRRFTAACPVATPR